MEGYGEELKGKTKGTEVLAVACWVAPVLGGCAWQLLPLAGVAPRIATTVFLILATLGLVMGLTALSRVPKHGREGVLVPSLIGIALNLLYLFMGAAAFM